MSQPIADDLIEYLDKPLELFEKLQDIRWSNKSSRTLGGDSSDIAKVKEVVIELNNTHQADICSLAVAAVDAGFSSHNIKYIVQDAIPFLSLNLGSLIAFLRIARLIETQPIKQLIVEQPKLINPLLDTLIDIADPAIVHFVPLIINETANTCIDQKHQALFSLFDHNKPPLTKAAINGLTDIQYNTETDQALLRQTLAKLDELITSNHNDLVERAVWCLCKLLYIGDEIKTKIFALAKEQNPVINAKICSFIFNYPEYINNEPWFEELLMTIVETPCTNNDMISSLDSILSVSFQKSGTQQLAEQFWVKWLTINPEQIYKHELKTLFGSTLVHLARQKKLLTPLVTRYINHDNNNVVQTAVNIIDYAKTYRKIPPSLDQSTLQSFNHEELLYICRKILGYIYLAESLQHLFYSILTAIINDNQMVQLLTNIFVIYIAKEYPNSTLKFLKDKQADIEQINELNKVVSQIIAAIELNIAPRNALPRLNELSISNQQRYQVALEKDKLNNREMEKAQAGSFLDCVTQIHIKYGKGSFNRFGGQYSQPNKFSSRSYSIEIPTSESYQPVHAAIHRMNFKRLKKGQ